MLSLLGRAQLCASMFSIALSSVAMAEDEAPGPWQLGVAAVAMDQSYDGVGREVLGFPLVIYRGERLEVFGPQASYRLSGDEHYVLKASASVRFGGYEPDDSVALRGMEQRDTSLDAGLSGAIMGTWGSLELSAIGDVLDKYNGQEVRLAYSYNFVGENYVLAPSVGMTWMSANLADYYYGVRPDEATMTRPAYRVGASTSPFIGLLGMYQLTARVSLLGMIQTVGHDDNVTASPIIGKDTSSFALISLVYSL